MTDDEFSRDLGPLGLLCVYVLTKGAASSEKDMRAFVGRNLRPGERIAVVDPTTGRTIGMVARRVDTESVRVEDEAALMAHIHDTRPDGLVDVDRFKPDVDTETLLSLARAYAPQLLDEPVVQIRDWAYAEVVAEAKAGKAVPGLVVDTKPGSVVVHPNAGAASAVEALLRSGRVTVDGAVHREIEGTQ
jgi:hypothetical protein